MVPQENDHRIDHDEGDKKGEVGHVGNKGNITGEQERDREGSAERYGNPRGSPARVNPGEAGG